MVFFLPGCGVLFGNVKPVEEKAKDYHYLDLSKETPPNWKRLSDPLGSDVAFQSKEGSSIISINSSCQSAGAVSREGNEARLRAFRNRLYLGVSDSILSRESKTVVSGVPALQTTVVGTMNDKAGSYLGPVVIHSVVLQDQGCSYALLSVSPTAESDSALAAFSRFERGFTLTSRQ
jgi:hypothetical protein